MNKLYSRRKRFCSQAILRDIHFFMRSINYLLISLPTIFLFSCTVDDDIPSQEHFYYRLKSKNYYFTDLSFNEVKYTYDSLGRILKAEDHNDKGEIVFTEKFFYEGAYLIKIERGTNQSKIAEHKFSYENGKLKNDEYWAKDTTGAFVKQQESTFEYAGADLKKVITKNSGTGTSFYSLYTYVEGNITNIKSYDSATEELIEEDIFEYDNKLNPYYKHSPQYVGTPHISSKNNVVHYKITSSKHIPQNPEMFYVYAYNSYDYPTEKFIKASNGKKYLDESYKYGLFN